MAKYKKRKDGRYESTITINGKKHHVYGTTIKEVETKKLELINNVKLGHCNLSSKTLFKDYKSRWFDAKKEMISAKSIAMYRSILINHFSRIDYKKLDTIKKTDIQLIMNDLKDKPNTANKVFMTLNQIFESAVDDDLIMKNPCRSKSIIIPKAKKKNKKRILNDTEFYLCEVSDFTDRERMFVYMSMYCGLRPEETRALTKNDFILNENCNYVIVNKTVVYVNNQPIFQKFTKNHTSTREVPLFGKIIPFIKYFLSTLSHDILFTNISDTEHYMTKQGYDWLIKKIKDKIYFKSLELDVDFDKKNFTPYIFRHTYATLLYYSGIRLKDAMYYMGHSDLKMLNDVYIHLDNEKLRNNEQVDIYLKNKLNTIGIK